MMVRKMLFVGFIIFLSIIPFFNCSADSPTYDAAYFKQFAPGQPQQITVQSRYPSGILEVCRAPGVYSMYNNPDDPKMNKDIRLVKDAIFFNFTPSDGRLVVEFTTIQDGIIRSDQKCIKLPALLTDIKKGGTISDIYGLILNIDGSFDGEVVAQVESGFDNKPMPERLPSNPKPASPQSAHQYSIPYQQWSIYH